MKCFYPRLPGFHAREPGAFVHDFEGQMDDALVRIWKCRGELADKVIVLPGGVDVVLLGMRPWATASQGG